MEIKLDDVFVSYARADAAKVDAWVRRLRAGGMAVWHDLQKDNGSHKHRLSAEEAAIRCAVLIWFVSKQNLVSPKTRTALELAEDHGRAVVVVMLDASPPPLVFQEARQEIAAMELLTLGPQGTWEALLKVVRSHGVPWISSSRPRCYRPNERRGAVLTRSWVRAAVISVLALILAGVILPRFKRGTPQAALPPEPSFPARVAPPNMEPQATPAPAPERDKEKEKDKPAEPAAPMVSTAPVAPVAPATPAVPVTSPVPEDPRSKRAVEFVEACIEAANRQDGLTPEKIDAIAAYFSDPVHIEDKGVQDGNALKASLFSRQHEWPKWSEKVHFIEAKEVPGTLSRDVAVQTSFTAENPSQLAYTTGVAFTHYEVDLSNLDQPKITAVHTVSVKPQ